LIKAGLLDVDSITVYSCPSNIGSLHSSLVYKSADPNMSAYDTATPPLSQGFGYGIVIGLGFTFALFMIVVTAALKRYRNEVQDSENFNTAGRTVKSGLVASAVVSSWTWAATLLQSTSVAYQYGVSGPFWYASGATVQIILFATLAIEYVSDLVPKLPQLTTT